MRFVLIIFLVFFFSHLCCPIFQVFGNSKDYRASLLSLSNILSLQSFAFLAQTEDSIRTNFETVLDVFRLHRKLVTHLPVEYLQTDLVSVCLQVCSCLYLYVFVCLCLLSFFLYAFVLFYFLCFCLCLFVG